MATEHSQKARVTLYWLEKSRAQRIAWFLEELGLEYDLKTYKRGKDMLAPPELKQVHPLGRSPVVTIRAAGAAAPVVLAESANIIEYLSEYYGKQLVPNRYPDGAEAQPGTETEEWLRYRHFMHFAEGSMMPFLLLALVVQNIKRAPVPFFLKPITRGIAGKIESGFLNKAIGCNFDFIEKQLATSPGGGAYLCGKELTGADILMIFPLEAAQGRVGLTGETYPMTNAYLARLQQRAAYSRAIERIEETTGEKYDASLG